MIAKKRPKHVDKNWVYNVLQIVFSLTVNTDIA